MAGRHDLDAAREEVAAVPVEPRVQAYIVAIARATRESPSLELGVSPRGATMLLHASKAWAWLAGKRYVTPDEVKAVAKPTLRHRVELRPEVELEGVTADGVLDGVLAAVPVPGDPDAGERRRTVPGHRAVGLPVPTWRLVAAAAVGSLVVLLLPVPPPLGCGW